MGALWAVAATVAVAGYMLALVLDSPISPQPLLLPTSHLPPNDALQMVEKLGEGEIIGPEAVMLDAKREFLYTATRDGWIKRMGLKDGVWEDWHFVGGSSLLGIAPSISGGLILCEADKGLFKVENGELVLLTSEVAGTPIRFADDAIEAPDGSIYFSDASTKFGLHSWFLDFLEAIPHGRLLKYNPLKNKTSIILADMAFPNGVSISSDQQYIVVCESSKFRCLKHWVKGEREGKTEVLVDNLPGAPDNINVAPDGSFWIALLETRLKKGFNWIHGSSLAKKVIGMHPGLVEMILPVRSRAMVVKVTPEGEITRVFDDSNGKVMSFVTSAVEHDGYLYIGSLATNFIGKLSLNISKGMSV